MRDKLNCPLMKAKEYWAFLRKFQKVTGEYGISPSWEMFTGRKVWINGKPDKNKSFSRFFYFQERDYSQLNLLLNQISQKAIMLRNSPNAKEGMDKVEEIMRSVIYKIDKDVNSECYRANQIYKKLSKKYVKHIFEYYLRHEFNANECCDKWMDAYRELINHPDFAGYSNLIKENYITFNTAFQFVFEYAYARRVDGVDMTADELLKFVANTYSLSSGKGYSSYRDIRAFVRSGNWSPVAVEKIKLGMETWANWMSDGKEIRKYNPIELACISHCMLVQMQAFPDGNHRLARLVANEVLIENETPPVYIPFDKRDEYNQATNKAIETHQLDDLIEIYYNQVLESANEINACLDKLVQKELPAKEEKTL